MPVRLMQSTTSLPSRCSMKYDLWTYNLCKCLTPDVLQLLGLSFVLVIVLMVATFALVLKLGAISLNAE